MDTPLTAPTVRLQHYIFISIEQRTITTEK